MSKNDMLNDYVEAEVISQLCELLNFSEDTDLSAFVRRGQLAFTITSYLDKKIDVSGIEMTLDRLVEKKIIEVISDELAGDFYSLNRDALIEFVKCEVQDVGSLLYKMNKVGSAFFDGAKEQAISGTEDGHIEYKSMSIPASDRIVRLDHNQISEADASVSEMISALEIDNGNPEALGLRERLLGQMRAARELIRVGEYKAYLMYELLARTLGEIIKSYGNPTIIALADALLGALVSKLIGGS